MGAAAASQPTVIRMVNPSTGAVFDFCGRWLRQSPATERDVRMGRAKFRGDRVYLDLPPGVQAQVDKGVLQLAGPEDEGAARHPADDLSDVLELPGLEDIPMPPARAPHAMWRDFAVAKGMDPETAAGLSRDQIRAAFASAVEAARDDEPLLEVLDEDREARNPRRRR